MDHLNSTQEKSMKETICTVGYNVWKLHKITMYEMSCLPGVDIERMIMQNQSLHKRKILRFEKVVMLRRCDLFGFLLLSTHKCHPPLCHVYFWPLFRFQLTQNIFVSHRKVWHNCPRREWRLCPPPYCVCIICTWCVDLLAFESSLFHKVFKFRSDEIYRHIFAFSFI